MKIKMTHLPILRIFQVALHHERQFPSTHEPAVRIVLALGSLGIVDCYRRRKKRTKVAFGKDGTWSTSYDMSSLEWGKICTHDTYFAGI